MLILKKYKWPHQENFEKKFDNNVPKDEKAVVAAQGEFNPGQDRHYRHQPHQEI